MVPVICGLLRAEPTLDIGQISQIIIHTAANVEEIEV